MNTIKIAIVGFAFWMSYAFICVALGAVESSKPISRILETEFLAWVFVSLPSAITVIIISLLNSRSVNRISRLPISILSAFLGAGIATYIGGLQHSWASIAILGLILAVAAFCMNSIHRRTNEGPNKTAIASPITPRVD